MKNGQPRDTGNICVHKKPDEDKQSKRHNTVNYIKMKKMNNNGPEQKVKKKGIETRVLQN